MSLLDHIPGYAEAVNREQLERAFAFMPEPMPICGVRVRHMTARHQFILEQCANRFVCGGVARPIDVAFFLWVLSPEYCHDERKRDAFIREKCAAAVSVEWLGEATRTIRERVQGTFADWPGGGGGENKQYVAMAAYIVDLFATEYGWSAETVMEAPLAMLAQLMRRIQMRKNPKIPLFNRSDAILGAALRGRN